MFRLKRVYEAAEESDGKRVLVDRLWPRGVSRETAALSVWMKEVAPSEELRKRFGHDPHKFVWFSERYESELLTDPVRTACILQLKEWADESIVTLLYAAKDPVHNHAVVLKRVLLDS